ncbi:MULTISPECIES: PD40 domain-containing protein [unclassified Dyella]|uniref:TolB family protein n=1 Tax=unclassified Dyella TaxID=2634549 RepID=UPI000C825B08|nr:MULTISPECIES: PD40 domain-containing protein [unclassified Dyella]MDR3443944.1 PD40 domain-containing protein [Dyella sp.]PMQ04757.1 Protein TolB [Dyella sp. AD56]
MWQQMICVVLLAISPLMAPLPADPPVPALFLAGDLGDSASPAFTPDGGTVYFMRGTDKGAAVMVSHRINGQWSAPMPAPFSGHWRDGDPSMAPDGSYLLFTSNRPAAPDGQPIDAVHNGKVLTGQGLNLWRVDRKGDGWSEPVRLPATVNTCNSSFAPSIAADDSIYYIGCAPDGVIRPLRATHENGQYQASYAVAVGDKDAQVRDVAIAPDRSFMVFSIRHDPKQPYRLAIAFHTAHNWSEPQDLGDTVNGGTHSMGSQLGCDHRTLYFSSDRALPASEPAHGVTSDDHIWRVSLTPWLAAHGLPSPSVPPSCVIG